MKFSVCGYVCYGLLGFLMLISMLIKFVIVPTVFEDIVGREMELKDGSEVYKLWRDTPIPYRIDVYMFTIENHDKIEAGDVPIFKEIGPFEFGRVKRKTITSNSNDENIKYNEKHNVTILDIGILPELPIIRKKSYNSINDTIHVLNAPLFTLFRWAEDEGLTESLNENLGEIFGPNTGVVIETTPFKLLFEGIALCNFTANYFCDALKKAVGDIKMLQDVGPWGYRFSFMMFNNERDEPFEIQRGTVINEIGNIVKWKNENKLAMWPDKDGASGCDAIKGTDGFIHAPFLKARDTRNIFDSDICKSYTLRYRGASSAKGIRTFEMVALDDVLPAATGNDSCFCVSETCLKKGVLDLYPCLGAPVVLSFPHFYLADLEYLNAIQGLNPVAAKHRYSVQLDPNFGIPIEGGKKFQYNMFAKKIGVESTNLLEKEVLFPIYWYQEKIFVPERITNVLIDNFYHYVLIYKLVMWNIIGLSSMLTVTLTLALIYIKLSAYYPKEKQIDLSVKTN